MTEMSLKQKVEQAAKFHRLFQGLVIVLANFRFNGKVPIDPNYRPKLIFKYEGGAVVNNREIVIHYDHFDNKIWCYDDFDKKVGEKEAKVTEEVVLELLDKIDWTVDDSIQDQVESYFEKEGIPKETLFPLVKTFCENPFGDPLRSLFINH